MSSSPLKPVSMLALACFTALTAMAMASDIPATMKAIALDKPGAPSVLTMHSLPVPKIAADEVLIAVHTASIGIWDADIRKKMTYVKAHYPYVPGSDGSGTVAAVGASVTGFKVGDAVYSYNWDNPKGGFYAEYVAVPAKHVGLVPKGMTLEQAGAFGVSGLTALSGIDEALHLKAGETLIIHGASGAVGTLAVQFAKQRGAKVFATASGDDGVALVRKLGADVAIDGRKGDITAAVRAFAPNGADAVLALASGDALNRCIAALRKGGRVAFPNGVDPRPTASNGITVTPFDASYDAPAFARLNKVVEAHQLEVPIAAEFPLADAAKAHERLEAGHLLGKIVLRVR
jgi:NADPH:quinone reductase-like Zn-dependent oxidoreductase